MKVTAKTSALVVTVELTEEEAVVLTQVLGFTRVGEGASDAASVVVEDLWTRLVDEMGPVSSPDRFEVEGEELWVRGQE